MMCSKKETVQLNDNAKEIFISGIDSNGIIQYKKAVNDVNKDLNINSDITTSNVESHPNEAIEEIVIDSLSDPYYPFKDNKIDDLSLSLLKDSVNSQIGPFSDNRPICDCEIIKQLFASSDARYLLSLLPDMAEMNSKQKTAFKNRIIQLIHRILNGDTIDVEI